VALMQPADGPSLASPGPIRVLVADRQVLFRQALHSILEEEPDLSVVGEIGEADEVVPEAERTRPDVILLDEALSIGSGRHPASVLRRVLPECQVVVIAAAEDDAGLLAAVEAGVVGYITRDVGLNDLIEGTREVHRGEALIPSRMLPSLLASLLERRNQEREALIRLSRLTAREREVLELLAAGAKNVVIANALMISPDTARTHVQNLLAKLGVHSRLEAAAFAVQVKPLEAVRVT
jgi:DNA-binding NarL/FixJ family response regulator